jgi:hypothetical protein
MSPAQMCITFKYILNTICKQKWWVSIYCLLYIFRKWNKRFLQSTGSKHVRILTLCIPTVVYIDHFYVQSTSLCLCVYVCMYTWLCMHACMHNMGMCIVHVEIHFLKETSLLIFPIICVLLWMWELWFSQQQNLCWWSAVFWHETASLVVTSM